jgi:phosphoribosylaminoimidazole-succinocarboxamide synthase
MPTTALPGYRHVYSGKVRDLYVPDGRDDVLLVVASDRISAYDHVLASTIPGKGRVLTALSVWWFERLADLVPNHLLSTDVPPAVAGRALLCERLDMVPVECVARGYLAGAHDENVDFAHVERVTGAVTAAELRRLTLALYARGEQVTRDRGIVLADTKVEFGRRSDGALVLADEVLTPDSSRFWPLDAWRPGRAQPSFDKQYVRNWLTSPDSGWDRSSGGDPPPLPDDVIARTRDRYVEAYERITGRAFV